MEHVPNAAPAAEKGTRNYIVLRRNERSQQGEDSGWREVELVRAANTDAAIEQAAKKTKLAGAYVAVPERNWHPVPGVTVSQETVVKLGGA